MEYDLKVNQQHIRFEVDAYEDSRLRICSETDVADKMGKNLYDVQYSIISENRIFMTVHHNGGIKQVNAYVSIGAEGKTVSLNGKTFLIKDLDILKQRPVNGTVPDTPGQITPPTPAVVVKIHVQVGDSVEKGQAVIVVSAMKMETTLYAPYDGTVLKINAAVKDKVAPGQILVDIEKVDKDTGINFD